MLPTIDSRSASRQSARVNCASRARSNQARGKAISPKAR